MDHLEGFQYATAFDLNMEYHNIMILPASQVMMKIVTEFAKFRYNRLPMGICASGDIFQYRVYKLLGDIEGVKTHTNNIWVLRKESFYKHNWKMMTIFGRFRAAGLRVNAPKCSFGLNAIPYLGYVISQEGIKLDTKKVKGITDFGRPTTMNEAWTLIGMVQYYRDMCLRWSHILDPQREAASGPKGENTLEWHTRRVL